MKGMSVEDMKVRERKKERNEGKRKRVKWEKN